MICSRKDFEELCGISRANYTTYRDRGKIFEQIDGSGNVLIDTDHPVNNAFYLNRKSILERKIIEQTLTSTCPEPEPQVKTPVPTKQTKPVKQRQSGKTIQIEGTKTPGGVKYELEVDKLDADVRLKELNIAVKEHELNTLLGNNIPSSIVMESFAQLAKSLLTGYRDYIEQEISNFCHKNKISDKERVAVMGKLVTGLNATHTKAVNEGRSTMKEGMKRRRIKNIPQDEQEDV